LFGRKCFPSVDLGKHWRERRWDWMLLALITGAALLVAVIVCRHALRL
jgi:hypothetical protein